MISPGHNAQTVGERLDPARVVTNFVLFKVEGGAERGVIFREDLVERGELLIAYNQGKGREVTHYGIGSEEIQKVIRASADALAASA